MIKALKDPDIFQTLKFRFWNIITGVVSLSFSSTWFTPIEQGFYFTFLSLVALQVFFELGLNYVATQIVAHETAHLDSSQLDSLNNRHLAKIQQVYLFLKKWNALAAPIFFFTTTFVGFYFFSQSKEIPVQEWLIPWVLLVLFTSINLFFSPIFAVAEGMGEVAAVANFRFRQSVIGHLLMWLSLFQGSGLWAAWIVQGVAVVFTLLFLRKDKKVAQHLKYFISNPVHDVLFYWKAELLPMQWRIALSWVSGYLLFQSLTPIIMLNRGPVDAGEVGLAIAGFNSVISLAMSLVNSKGPSIAILIAKGNITQAKKIYFINSITTTILVIIGSCAIIILALVSSNPIFNIELRLPDFPTILALSINSTANSIVFASAVFMRAHKVEPMVLVSIVGGLISILLFYIGSLHSTDLAFVYYTAVTCFIILPWSLLILRRFTNVSN